MLRRSLAAASIAPLDSVLEVGAGIGTLTLGLADRAGWVTAVEIDRFLLPALQATAGPRRNVRIVQGDILKLTPTALFSGPPDAPRKVVANLPYNIASAVLTRTLEQAAGISRLVVTVQREVADRIVARPGTRTYGMLSVAVQFYAVPRILERIPGGAFLPPPEVESALLELVPLAAPQVEVSDTRTFFEVVGAGFAKTKPLKMHCCQAVADEPPRSPLKLFTPGCPPK